jgi:hypothetical protein
MNLQASDRSKTKGTAKYSLNLKYNAEDSINTNIIADTLSTEIKHFGLVSALDSTGVRKEFSVSAQRAGVAVSSSEALSDIKVYLITKTIKVFYAVIQD